MLTEDKKARKEMPIARGVLDYFPLALAAVAGVSFTGNEQHNPGQPMHWAKHLSTDHADCILRHLIDRGTTDTDGLLHTAKVAWRALALLETELEAEGLSMTRTEERWDALKGADQQPVLCGCEAPRFCYANKYSTDKPRCRLKEQACFRSVDSPH